MPKIPTYDSRQVAPNAAPAPQFQAPQVDQLMTGQRQIAGLQQANSQFTQQVAAIGADMNQRYTVQRLTDSEAQLTDALSAFNTEARQRVGENAKGLSQDAQTFWDKTTRSISEGLDDDVQRAAFNRIAARRRPTFTAGIAGHEFEQGKVAANAAGDASINTSISAAAAAAIGGMTPLAQQEIATNKESALRTLEATLTANGLQGTLPDKRMQLTTKLHAEIIQSLIPTDPDAAKAWYYSNKKEIDGTKQAEIEKMLDKGGMLSEVQKAADYVFQNKMSLDDAFAYAEKNFSGETEERLKVELKHRYQEKNLIDEQKKQTALAPSQKILAEAATRGSWISAGVRQSELNRLVAFPDLQQQVAQEFARHNEHMQNLADSANARARANAEKMLPSDAQVANWYQLKTEPETLRAIDLTKMRNSKDLTEKQFNDLVGDQQQLRKGGREKEENLLGDHAAVMNVLTAAGIKWDKDTADGAAKLGKFYEAFDARVRIASAGGKHVTQAQKEDIARALVHNVVVEGAWFGTNTKPAITVTKDDKIVAKETTVPPMERDRIINALRRNNKPVTEAEIKYWYLKGLKE